MHGPHTKDLRLWHSILNMFDQNKLLDNTFGTPAFQPPEVINGPDGFFGHVKDIWSSGITLCYIMSGILPFQGENLGQLYNSITHNEPLILFDDMDTDFLDLVTAMLTKNYRSRATLYEIKKKKYVLR
ncbi:hypothetical protein MXB_3266 [Myxobolus squamalis]|nr:hypothetical protein MXB_3266 [Myxobolus squamalis]